MSSSINNTTNPVNGYLSSNYSQTTQIIKLKKKRRFRRSEAVMYVGADIPVLNKHIYKSIGVINSQLRSDGLTTSEVKSIYLSVKSPENSISLEKVFSLSKEGSFIQFSSVELEHLSVAYRLKCLSAFDLRAYLALRECWERRLFGKPEQLLIEEIAKLLKTKQLSKIRKAIHKLIQAGFFKELKEGILKPIFNPADTKAHRHELSTYREIVGLDKTSDRLTRLPRRVVRYLAGSASPSELFTALIVFLRRMDTRLGRAVVGADMVARAYNICTKSVYRAFERLQAIELLQAPKSLNRRMRVRNIKGRTWCINKHFKHGLKFPTKRKKRVKKQVKRNAYYKMSSLFNDYLNKLTYTPSKVKSYSFSPKPKQKPTKDPALPPVNQDKKQVKNKNIKREQGKTTAEGRRVLDKLGNALSNQSNYRPDRYVSNREKANRKYQSTESRRQMLLTQAALLQEQERNEKESKSNQGEKKVSCHYGGQESRTYQSILFALQYTNSSANEE